MQAIAALTILLALWSPATAQSSRQLKSEKPKLAPISDDFSGGFAQAVAEHRFLIMFFRDKTLLTTQEEAEIAKLRADPQFSSIFLFAQANLPDDQTAMNVAQELKLHGVPAVSVLVPDRVMLRELTRFEGVFLFADLRKGIVTAMCKAAQTGRFGVDAKIAKPLRCGAK